MSAAPLTRSDSLLSTPRRASSSSTLGSRSSSIGSRRLSSSGRSLGGYESSAADQYINSHLDQVENRDWRGLVQGYATGNERANEAAHDLSPAYRRAVSKLGLPARSRSPSPSRTGAGYTRRPSHDRDYYTVNTGVSSFHKQHNEWQDAIKEYLPKLHAIYPSLQVSELAHVLSSFYVKGGHSFKGQLNYTALDAALAQAPNGGEIARLVREEIESGRPAITGYSPYSSSMSPTRRRSPSIERVPSRSLSPSRRLSGSMDGGYSRAYGGVTHRDVTARATPSYSRFGY